MNTGMKILVGCEESQAVCIELRKMGHEAYSNDTLPCSGGHPEWHIQGDVFVAINGGRLTTQSGEVINIDNWDMLIVFPPCTRLTVTANKWYKPEFAHRFQNIHEEREEAVKFFMALANCGIPKIAIENPVGIMSTRWRKPDQIIQPWQFGDKAIKKTCLWLKNLTPLKHTEIVEPEYKIYNAKNKKSGQSKYPINWTNGANAKERSKTFPGIAKAMAQQWGAFLKGEIKIEKQMDLFSQQAA